ncbi:hypothetical protein BDEG_24339 [Batrachochytrium dendrobatidis JEL423]|uniref:adenylate cyclase n=1 Tax=Batrachochytrium dendrobatidis (strain JEL423) TaxID=403673 RepID=A0A177WMN2_BATDL|nr:hypothetical protein BDEG_24339 [Batrachochytrium dendrobatidis JEL423]
MSTNDALPKTAVNNGQTRFSDATESTFPNGGATCSSKADSSNNLTASIHIGPDNDLSAEIQDSKQLHSHVYREICQHNAPLEATTAESMLQYKSMLSTVPSGASSTGHLLLQQPSSIDAILFVKPSLSTTAADSPLSEIVFGMGTLNDSPSSANRLLSCDAPEILTEQPLITKHGHTSLSVSVDVALSESISSENRENQSHHMDSLKVNNVRSIEGLSISPNPSTTRTESVLKPPPSLSILAPSNLLHQSSDDLISPYFMQNLNHHYSPNAAMQSLIAHTTPSFRNQQQQPQSGNPHQHHMAPADAAGRGSGYTGGVLPLLMGVLPRRHMTHSRRMSSHFLQSDGNLAIEGTLQQRNLQQPLQPLQHGFQQHTPAGQIRAQRKGRSESLSTKLRDSIYHIDRRPNGIAESCSTSNTSLKVQFANQQLTQSLTNTNSMVIPAARISITYDASGSIMHNNDIELESDIRMLDSLQRKTSHVHSVDQQVLPIHELNQAANRASLSTSCRYLKTSRSHSTIQQQNNLESSVNRIRHISLMSINNIKQQNLDSSEGSKDSSGAAVQISNSYTSGKIKTDNELNPAINRVIDLHDAIINDTSSSKKKHRTAIPKVKFLDPFFHPFEESPTTGWTLKFPPTIEAMFQIYIFYIILRKSQGWILLITTIGWAVFCIADWLLFPGLQHYTRLIGNLVPLTVSICNIVLSFRKDWETRCYQGQLAYTIVAYLQNLNISYHIGYLNAVDMKDLHGLILLNTLCTVMISYTVLASPYVHISIASLIFCATEFVMEVSFKYYSTSEAYIASGLLFIAANITGIFFKYSYELHLRKAFVRYRLLYHNQEELTEARERSDALLGMVLPAKIVASMRLIDDSDANRLKESVNSLFAELHGVTILFADIAGFTEFSGTVTASALVDVLSELFSMFDAIASDLQLEKIKTIGDSIHIAGGVPEQLRSREEIALFAKRVCIMGVEMMKGFNQLCIEKGMHVKLRVGIHTGSVVGGVMGLWKFKYDIWSQDVDIASLMEQTGTPGIPHISESTYELIQDDPDFLFSPAETVPVLGREISTYHITAMREESSSAEPNTFMLGGIPRSSSKNITVTTSSVSMMKQKSFQSIKKSDAMTRFDLELNRYLCLFKNPDKEHDYRTRFMETSSASFGTATIVIVCVQVIIFGVLQTINSSRTLLLLDILILIALIFMGFLFYVAQAQHNSIILNTSLNSLSESLALVDRPLWPWWLPNAFAISIFFVASVSTASHMNTLTALTAPVLHGCHTVLMMLYLTFFGIKSLYLRLWLVTSTLAYILGFLYLCWSRVSDRPGIVAMIMETVILASLCVIIFSMSWYTDLISRMNFFMESENEVGSREMEITQQAAERLIMNILPLSVVQRLANVEQIQIADDREDVAIIFTSISNSMQYGIEKIKTIGTKYMAMGEPIENDKDDALIRTCEFGLALLTLIQDINQRLDQDFKLKIGVNVGPAVTGLIGTKTFAFDVWGDTVNVSSRMESTGKENQIQVTQTVYDRCRDIFKFEERGTVHVKGKGEMMTYWLVDYLPNVELDSDVL